MTFQIIIKLLIEHIFNNGWLCCELKCRKCRTTVEQLKQLLAQCTELPLSLVVMVRRVQGPNFRTSKSKGNLYYFLVYNGRFDGHVCLSAENFAVNSIDILSKERKKKLQKCLFTKEGPYLKDQPVVNPTIRVRPFVP